MIGTRAGAGALRWAPCCGIALGVLAACSGGNGNGDEPQPLFPASYTESYSLVHDCRLSIEHDFSPIRVFTAPGATEAYTGREQDFPVGAVVLKEEYGE